MPDVSNWPAGQTGSIGRSIKLPRRRAQRRFSSRAIQIQLPHPVVAVSIHAPRTHAPAYTCTHTRPSGISPSGYFSPSSRPASCATQRRVFVQFSFLAEAFLLPPRFAPFRPAPPRAICFPILFPSRLFPLLPSAPSGLPATELFLPSLTSRFRLATSRVGSSGSVSKVSPTSSKYAIFSHFSDSISQKRIYT